jgi:serine phosphatase RsbU (regulator of sigma subunit)
VARSLRQFASRDAVSPMPIQRVIETGAYELHASAGGDLLRDASASDVDRGVWQSLDIRSVLILPMVARGRTIGAISFVGAESGREFAEEDVVFAERLAAQCALAVDNARLFGERADIARHLQESLLPPLLPDLPGMSLAARYRAAGAGNDVGGDFYDVFPTGPGQWLLAIGDVQGKGPGAAAITGLARYTMRAAATQNPDPVHVLSLLNEALLDGQRFLTVAYIALRIREDEAPVLSIVNGGHPTPFLIRADGSVTPLGRHGMLVGITSPLELKPLTVALSPGDSIVLYTDGVIEAGEEPLGEDGLARLLTGCAGLSADAIADRVAGVVLDAGGTPRDDVAVLVARVESD